MTLDMKYDTKRKLFIITRLLMIQHKKGIQSIITECRVLLMIKVYSIDAKEKRVENTRQNVLVNVLINLYSKNKAVFYPKLPLPSVHLLSSTFICSGSSSCKNNIFKIVSSL